jgi:hypothetical protein
MKKVIVIVAFAAAAVALYGSAVSAQWNPSYGEPGAAFQHQAEERAAQRHQHQEEQWRYDEIQQFNNPHVDMHVRNMPSIDDEK